MTSPDSDVDKENKPLRNDLPIPSTLNPFRIRDLPKELRLRIYEYALGEEAGLLSIVDPPSLYITNKPDDEPKLYKVSEEKNCECDMKHPLGPNVFPHLLCTSREIYAEAAPILYKNQFVFATVVGYSRFVKNIGANRRYLKRIKASAFSRHYLELNTDRYVYEGDLTALQEFTLSFPVLQLRLASPHWPDSEYFYNRAFSPWIKAAWKRLREQNIEADEAITVVMNRIHLEAYEFGQNKCDFDIRTMESNFLEGIRDRLVDTTTRNPDTFNH